MFPPILQSRFEKSELKKRNRYIFENVKNIKSLPKGIKKENAVILISGTSGSGKDSIIDLLPKNFKRIKTCTTRSIRPGEVKNDPYIRLSINEFQKGIQNKEFLETNLYDDNYYGSKISEIKKVSLSGNFPVLRIDPTGAKNAINILKRNSNILEGIKIIYFFVIPPSEEIIKQRIYKRDVETVSDLRKKKIAQKNADKRFKGTVLKDLDLSKHAHFFAINYDGELNEVVKNIVKIFSEYI